jgi:hypothetical protein
MIKKNYVIDARGKRIEVVTRDDLLDHVTPKRHQRSDQRFAKLTEERQKLLAGVSAAAWAIYSYLLMVNWKNLRHPVKLTNEVLAELSIPRYAKCRALRQLEHRGLIKVERRIARQAPIVTPLK